MQRLLSSTPPPARPYKDARGGVEESMAEKIDENTYFFNMFNIFLTYIFDIFNILYILFI